jgi:hypothetical protein
MSEAVANVRWLIAADIRDFQAMLDGWASSRRTYPATPQHPTSPTATIRVA